MTITATRDADHAPVGFTANSFASVSLDPPHTATLGRLCWGETHLYVAFDGVDEDLKGSITAPDSSVYLDDVYEIFFQPGVYDDGYHNFEINVLGTVYDAHNGTTGSAYDCAGLEYAIVRDGTLNNSADHDSGWRMEVAIPFGSLVGLAKPRPDVGDVWPFHLARYDYSVYIPGGKELSSCAPLTLPKYHNRSDWIELHFLPPPPPPRGGVMGH